MSRGGGVGRCIPHEVTESSSGQSWSQYKRQDSRRRLADIHTGVAQSRYSVPEDPGWENVERTYHETGLEEVNSLIRKHIVLAPHAVRRAYYMQAAELDRVSKHAAEDVLRGLEERAREDYRAP